VRKLLTAVVMTSVLTHDGQNLNDDDNDDGDDDTDAGLTIKVRLKNFYQTKRQVSGKTEVLQVLALKLIWRQGKTT